MIKINLLLVKKKKKAKPLPSFLISTVFITIGAVIVMTYVYFVFSARLQDRQNKVSENDKKIEELTRQIKDVEDYEKRNADFTQRKDIIEQLSKNKTVPVKVIDEISRILPSGVWLTSMTLNGIDLNLRCVGFTNTDVVNFVNNMKSSKMFADVYLTESVQGNMSGFPVYSFGITAKVKG